MPGTNHRHCGHNERALKLGLHDSGVSEAFQRDLQNRAISAVAGLNVLGGGGGHHERRRRKLLGGPRACSRGTPDFQIWGLYNGISCLLTVFSSNFFGGPGPHQPLAMLRHWQVTFRKRVFPCQVSLR